MSLWTKLGKWADNMEKQRTASIAQKNAASSSKLTKAYFANTLSALDGSITTLFKLSGEITVQRLGEMVARYVDDLGGVIVEKLSEQEARLQHWLDHTFKLYDNSLHQLFTAFNTAAEQRHAEQESWAFGLSEKLKASDANNSARYLAMQERISQLSADNMNQHNVAFGTMVGLFENLTEQIQRANTRKSNAPTLEWVMENADELIRLGTSLRNLQENNVPPATATGEVVRSIRQLLGYDITLEVIGSALGDKTVEWSMAA